MPDGVNIGSGYIEIYPELDLTRMQRVQREIENHLSGMTRAVNREMKAQYSDIAGAFSRQVKSMQSGSTSGVFAQYREEMKAAQSLEKQRQAAIAATQKAEAARSKAAMDGFKQELSAFRSVQDMKSRMTKAEDAASAARGKSQLDALNTSMTAAKSLEVQRQRAMEQEAIDEQTRMRLIEQGANAEIRAKERVRREQEVMTAASAKAARAEVDMMNRQFAAVKSLGSEFMAAYDRDAAARAKFNGGSFSGLSGGASSAASSANRALDSMSSHLSQLSTRIGIASFQLQMLGGMLAGVVTGPVITGFAILTKAGMGFAVSTDQAVASLKAMLPVGYNVEALVGRLQKMAVASPAFNADDVVMYTSKLVAAGLSISQTERLMQSLSNIFATFGVSGQSAELALKGISQVQQKGKVYAEELTQQIGEQIPIFDLLGKSLGVTQQELQKMIKDGMSSQTFIDALIKIGNSKRFLDGAANSVTTLGGAWQQFTEKFRTQLGNAFLANKDAILKALKDIEPVVQDFINWFISMIPVAVDALGRLVRLIRDWKAVYDNLSPAQRELVNELAMITVAAGPAAVAIGIFGTALSGVVNAASLLTKVLSFAGLGVGTGVFATIAGVIIALAAAMTYLYNVSEPFRKIFLQTMNVLKDMVANILLPAINRLWSEIVMLGRALEALGMKPQMLAYALYILAVPILALTAAVYALDLVFKALWASIVLVAGVVELLMNVLASTLVFMQSFYEVLSYLPGTLGEAAGRTAADIQNIRNKMVDLVDTMDLYNKITGKTSGATDGFKNDLKNVDFTATGLGGTFNGLSGAFTGMNTILDTSTQKWANLTEGIVNARAAMDGGANSAKSVKDASDAYHKSLIQLEKSVQTNKHTLDENSQAGQANRDALKAAASASYELMLQDIASKVPMDEAIRRHRDRTAALLKEVGGNKETRATAQSLIDTYGKVPKDVATLLKLMGYTNVEKAMDQLTINQMALQKGISVTEAKRQYEKDRRLAQMATGGLVRGPGGPTDDAVPAMLSNMEYVIKASSAQRLGKHTLDWLNNYGELPPGFAKGGQATWPYPVNVSKTKIPEIPLGGPAMGSGGMGWQRQIAVLRQAFPGLALLSGYREGAVTSTGNTSYHALGRAVDVPPRMDVFNWIRNNWMNSTRELIHTPAGSRQIKNGQNHVFTGGTIQQDHYNHIHWAHDNGGWIKPNEPFINNTSSAELALNAAQGKALEEKIRDSNRPISVCVYVDGVKRDAEIVFEEKTDELIRTLGGV